MPRLISELQRLFQHPPSPGTDAGGQVRAMALTLARPADWDALSAVWRGVQAELGLPAPAIAVSGIDGYQLWFSLTEPVPAAHAMAWLDGLRRRYLGEIDAARIGMQAGANEALPPPQQQANGLWSAFVAPDLAPVFADEPWLDTPPSREGQADLLARLQGIQRADFEASLARLANIQVPAPAPTQPTPLQRQPRDSSQDPRHFLLGVMNDERLEMGLRIEAAKALLQHR
jgi:hypothetical protein